MSSTRHGRLLPGQLTCALVCSCLLAGCSQERIRPPASVPLISLSRPADAEATPRLTPLAPPPAASVPGDRPSGADGTVAGHSLRAAAFAAGDPGVGPATFSPDSVPALPLSEAIGFAL